MPDSMGILVRFFRITAIAATTMTLSVAASAGLVDTDSGVSGSLTGNAFAVGTRNISAGGGKNSGGDSQEDNGLMDEIYISDNALILDNALTTTEISSLFNFSSLETVSIAEPGAIAFFGLGLLGLGYSRRRVQDFLPSLRARIIALPKTTADPIQVQRSPASSNRMSAARDAIGRRRKSNGATALTSASSNAFT